MLTNAEFIARIEAVYNNHELTAREQRDQARPIALILADMLEEAGDIRCEKVRQLAGEHFTRDIIKRLKVLTQLDPAGLQVGDILYSSWGYEQTNIDYYEVIKRTPKMVTVRELKKTQVETGFMTGDSTPLPGQYDDRSEPLRRRIDSYNGEPIIRINDYARAYFWTGEAKNYSSYA